MLVEFMVSARGWTVKVRYGLVGPKVRRKVVLLKPVAPFKR